MTQTGFFEKVAQIQASPTHDDVVSIHFNGYYQFAHTSSIKAGTDDSTVSYNGVSGISYVNVPLETIIEVKE